MVAPAAPVAAGVMTTGVDAWGACPACMGAWAGAATSATCGAAAWGVLAPTEVPEIASAVVCRPAAHMDCHKAIYEGLASVRPHTKKAIGQERVGRARRMLIATSS